METLTEIEVCVIEDTVVGVLFNGRLDREVLTNTFIFPSLEQAKKFAGKCVKRSSTVIVTDVTNEQDKILFNSKRFCTIPEAKKVLKSI
jgi:hypothetical protein